MRTLNIEILDGKTLYPDGTNNAGEQGEHLATQLVIALPDYLINFAPDYYIVEFKKSEDETVYSSESITTGGTSDSAYYLNGKIYIKVPKEATGKSECFAVVAGCKAMSGVITEFMKSPRIKLSFEKSIIGDTTAEFSNLESPLTVAQRGLSAYEVAKNNGYSGTEAQWLVSIRGRDVSSATIRSADKHLILTLSDNTTKDCGVAVPPVVDNLTSTSATDALSANQGKILGTNKLDKTGDSVSNTTSFTEAITLASINSTETHATLFGKIKKLFTFINVSTALNTSSQTVTGAINELNTGLMAYPVGSIYMSVNSTDPSILFGGIWEAWGTGRVPVGVDTSQTDFNTVEKTGGEKEHTLTVNEMPSHRHESHMNFDAIAQNSLTGWPTNTNGFNGVYTDYAGGGLAHNNLQPYITCYMWKRISEDDIVGVEVDFENRKFERLAGAVGKTPGADFDNILAFGGRRKCNLSDLGVVNAYFGEPGYIEDGSNGQVMVEQPKFYYKVVPLNLEKNDEVEIASIVFTAASASGNITITLNGTAFNVAVAAGDNATAVATKVRNTAFAGWTTSGSGATVVFTATKVGAKVATTFTDTGTTGVTGTITRTQCGYIGKGFKLRKARYYISMTNKAGFKVHPAFVKNNVEKEKIYLSAYEGCAYDVSASAFIFDDAQTVDFTAINGDKLSSRASVKPISGNTQDLTRRKCGIIAENRGIGWSQQYAATAACTQLLFTVEYAALNSQTAIGRGVVDKASGEGNESEITGATTLLGNASGMAAGTNGLVSITYRGEENFWGNIYKFTDGMNIYCDIANSVHDLYVADNTFAESTQASPYANAGITLATRSGYVSAMAYSETYDWLFVPAETLGDSALPVGDYAYVTPSLNGYRIACLGGSWNVGAAAGGFYWYLTYGVGNRARVIGGRLVYVPTATV